MGWTLVSLKTALWSEVPGIASTLLMRVLVKKSSRVFAVISVILVGCVVIWSKRTSLARVNSWPQGYKTWGHSQTQNKAQLLAACGHVKLKIRRNYWLLADTCPPAFYFEFENELKFYNLEARFETEALLAYARTVSWSQLMSGRLKSTSIHKWAPLPLGMCISLQYKCCR